MKGGNPSVSKETVSYFEEFPLYDIGADALSALEILGGGKRRKKKTRKKRGGKDCEENLKICIEKWTESSNTLKKQIDLVEELQRDNEKLKDMLHLKYGGRKRKTRRRKKKRKTKKRRKRRKRRTKKAGVISRSKLEEGIEGCNKLKESSKILDCRNIGGLKNYHQQQTKQSFFKKIHLPHRPHFHRETKTERRNREMRDMEWDFGSFGKN